MGSVGTLIRQLVVSRECGRRADWFSWRADVNLHGTAAGMENFGKSDLAYAPILVFVASFFVDFTANVVQTQLSWYGLLMGGVEAGLGFILTLIFLQAIPVHHFVQTKRSIEK